MKKTVIFIISFCLLVVFPVRVYAEEAVQSTVKSTVLMCMNTGDIIAENNAYEHLSPASVTKIMSILLFLEAIDSGQISLTDPVTASENAQAMGGSQIWLEVGEIMSVDELLRAVVIASANDACVALSEYVGGSADGFVQMMNDRLAELGLENSHFENCTGLDDDTVNHYSCAYDLAVIAKEVMKHELVLDYTTVWLDYLRGGETELNNTNKLINTYDGLTGLKTGTTSNAGFCLCATAARDGLSFVAVVLGADTSEVRFDTAAQLLDQGFASYTLVTPEINESQITTVKVIGGRQKSVLPVYDETVELIIEKNSGDLEYEYIVEEKVQAPIKKGTKLGEILVKSDGETVSKIPLVSDQDLEKINFQYIFYKCFGNI